MSAIILINVLIAVIKQLVYGYFLFLLLIYTYKLLKNDCVLYYNTKQVKCTRGK